VRNVRVSVSRRVVDLDSANAGSVSVSIARKRRISGWASCPARQRRECSLALALILRGGVARNAEYCCSLHSSRGGEQAEGKREKERCMRTFMLPRCGREIHCAGCVCARGCSLVLKTVPRGMVLAREKIYCPMRFVALATRIMHSPIASCERKRAYCLHACSCQQMAPACFDSSARDAVIADAREIVKRSIK